MPSTPGWSNEDRPRHILLFRALDAVIELVEERLRRILRDQAPFFQS